MGIPIGKLSLYVAGSGFNPSGMIIRWFFGFWSFFLLLQSVVTTSLQFAGHTLLQSQLCDDRACYCVAVQSSLPLLNQDHYYRNPPRYVGFRHQQRNSSWRSRLFRGAPSPLWGKGDRCSLCMSNRNCGVLFHGEVTLFRTFWRWQFLLCALMWIICWLLQVLILFM